MDNREEENRKRYSKPSMTVDELSAALYYANQQLEKKNHELYEQEQARIEMFANISHDLRSPITAIRSAIEYVSSISNIDEEELRSMFQLMLTRIISLESLINDIFLLANLDSNSLKLDIETIELGPILEEFFYSCEVDNKYKERRLYLDVPESFSYMVSIDVMKFIHVLDNLFTNALKYSNPNDFIRLGAKVSEVNVIVWVEDSGIGIEEELCEKVFERSYTVNSARTPQKTTSCGLGLSIAKSIIEKMNGHIWCESELHKGSTFFISLPIS